MTRMPGFRDRDPGSSWRLGAGLAVLAALALVPGLRPAQPWRMTRKLMGTDCTIAWLGPHRAAVEAALDEITRVEAIISHYDPDSDLSRLGTEPHRVAPELIELIERARAVSQASGGAFDMTLTAGGWREVHTDRAAGTAWLGRPGLRLDPGGIGKGYALDRAASVLRKAGVDQALLDFGSTQLAIGGPWSVRLEATGETVALTDEALSVSSQAWQPGHIQDPRTGRPAAGPRAGVVRAPTATDADALSTAAFVLGPNGDWLHFVREMVPVPFPRRAGSPPVHSPTTHPGGSIGKHGLYFRRR